MNYSLRWTEEAKKSFNQNLEYLSDEWDNQIINNFLDRVDGILSRIKSNPEIYSLHRKTHNIRKCVVHKRIILYFKIVDSNNIDLLTFWNTYQDPDKLLM